MNPPVMTTSLAGLGPRHQGKVRDIYDLGDKLLLVATDRISAFDVVMNEPIPDKGRILTRLSAFWFRHLADLTPNHLVSLKVEEFPPACRPFKDLLEGRTMLVRKCKPLPVECIVRGYLSGSGWAEYRQTGAIGGERCFVAEVPITENHDSKLRSPIAEVVVGDDAIAEETVKTVQCVADDGGANVADMHRFCDVRAGVVDDNGSSGADSGHGRPSAYLRAIDGTRTIARASAAIPAPASSTGRRTVVPFCVFMSAHTRIRWSALFDRSAMALSCFDLSA